MQGSSQGNGPTITFPITFNSIYNAHVTRRVDMAYSTATWSSFPYNLALYPIRGLTLTSISIHSYDKVYYYILVIGI